jgi:Leucine-rich repeat (LRR) protein
VTLPVRITARSHAGLTMPMIQSCIHDPTDLEGVQYYRQLTALDCTGSKITDISALKHCPALTSLNLTGCRFVMCVRMLMLCGYRENKYS